MSSTPWGDQNDSDDDDEEEEPMPSTSSSLGKFKIPPTQRSRVDSKGIQIVTSYRQNPSHKSQLLKTVTKVRVTTERVKEPLAVAARRDWAKFGQAALDAKQGVKTTVQSKDEILLEDPNADTDLQEEDPTAAFGNLNAFWAKQQKRQLQRKYDVETDDAAPGDKWTQVGAASSGGKYVPPSMRGGATGTGVAFQPERRTDDLNTIRVTNLSDGTTEADLQDLFARYGRISRVYLAKDKETLQSRGFAFVSFVNKDDAAVAMKELQGIGYNFLILKLEWARPNAPKDPGAASEYRSGYGKALAQDTKERVSYASNLTK